MLDTWQHIFRFCSTINFETNQSLHYHLNKDIYEQYKFIMKEREINHQCMICGNNDLIKHHCDDEDDCIDECPSSSGNVNIIYRNKEKENIKWLICEKCEAFHNVCVCDKYRNLYSHPGEFIIKDVINRYKSIYTFNETYEDGSCITAYVTNNNINFFSRELGLLTGPDGGYVHSWICKNNDCIEYNKMKEYTDK